MAERPFCTESLNERTFRTRFHVFFGGFPGDHKAFSSWNKDFQKRQRSLQKEAQQRLMTDVGGTGKYNATPPSTLQ